MTIFYFSSTFVSIDFIYVAFDDISILFYYQIKNKIIIISFLSHFFFIMVDRIFKCLHPITRFTAIDKKDDFLSDLNISPFSIKSMKPTFNFKIVKMFCGIEKNNAKTKKKTKKFNQG